MTVQGKTTQVAHGSPEKIGATRRVALTMCVVEYQTSAWVENDGSFLNRSVTRATTKLHDVPIDVFQKVVDDSCARLRRELSSAGYEVLPDAEVMAQPAFQKLLTLSAADTPMGLGSHDGGTLVLSNSALRFYFPSGNEEGPYHWGRGQFTDVTWDQAYKDAKPAPSAYARSRNFDVPLAEIELAKALNALVVKSWSILKFGGVTASSEREWGGRPVYVWNYGTGRADMGTERTVTYSGAAKALLAVRENQTRLSVRVADGDTRYRANTATGDKVPPMDGDVVFTLASPILGGNAFFKVEEAEKPAAEGAAQVVSGLFSALGGRRSPAGQAAFVFRTTITDPPKYREAANAVLGVAHRDLVAALRRP